MNRLLRLAMTLGCAALLAAGGAAAQHQHGSHGGGAAKAPPPGLNASAVFDSAGALWAVYRDGPHARVRRSSDLGKTWAPPVTVNAAPEEMGADGDSRPKIAAGPSGELYVTWTKPLSKPYTGDIRFSRSVDGGKSFSAPITVHTDKQEITHRFDAVIANRAGQVFVVWIDKRDGVAAAKAKTARYRGAAIYYAVSDDRGATFRGDFKVADHSCECCRIALLPRDDGSVVAMWRHVFEPNVRDHGMARLTPEGKAVDFHRATFEDWRIDACPHHGPSLGADADGTLHAVWFSQGAGREGISYGRLVKGAVEGQRRVGRDSAEHADLAVAGRRVAIVWKEFDGKKSVLRAMTSEDAGRTWKESDLATTAGASGHPFVLARDGRFYAFWNTRQEPLSVTQLP